MLELLLLPEVTLMSLFLVNYRKEWHSPQGTTGKYIMIHRENCPRIRHVEIKVDDKWWHYFLGSLKHAYDWAEKKKSETGFPIRQCTHCKPPNEAEARLVEAKEKGNERSNRSH